ncbi:MAG: phage tail sheath family protein [Verrucomicrobia bacterium]|nr:MAG: phage tail sheath family protein [Verrucomicrobiota bacterium]
MPPEFSYPGVYVEEQFPAGHTIPGVPTSVTAFIGPTRKGPLNRPFEVGSFSQFEQRFGVLSDALETGHAVRQYFLNGGREAWVVRVAKNPIVSRFRMGLKSLDAVKIINLLVLPGLTSPQLVALAAGYCQTRRAFLLLDGPASARTPEQMEQFVRNLAFDARSHAAIYYPWILVANPLAPSSPRMSPPSGTIAGMIARVDTNRGVWKAPAGTEATLNGVTGLERNLTDTEIGRLNPRGVNCLRSLPVQGCVAWGARTLAGDDLSAAEFKYIPVRRTALFIEESVAQGIQWAVFEPNAELTWARLRASVTVFMDALFRQGALAGTKSKEAYFVKCGRDTTTTADINAGIVNVVVGFAPLKPAEFVVIRLRQSVGSAIS